MTSGLIGYHPERIADLHRRVVAAIDDLGSMASTDPAAANALDDVARARARLETDWLPLLQRIATSRAMLDRLDVANEEGGVGLTPVSTSASGTSSNDEALAPAKAAASAGVTGSFAGTTKTYEVVGTPPSTTLPNAQNCDRPDCSAFDIIVHDTWYVEHNVGQGPAVFASLPGVRWIGLAARLFGRRGRDDVLSARAKDLEAVAEQARQDAGAIRKGRNVAVGRLTRSDGEEIDFRSVSGRARRPGFEDPPTARLFEHGETRGLDAELKILESVARDLARSDADAVLEVFSELPPCPSCRNAFEQFHQMYPNVQVRFYYRMDVAAG